MEYITVLDTIKKCIASDLGSSSFQVEKNRIIFKCNNITYMCIYEKEEPNYLQVLVPSIDTTDHITSTETYEEILELNAKYKNAKFIIINKSIWIASELFLTGQEYIAEALVVMVRILEVMRSEYAKVILNK